MARLLWDDADTSCCTVALRLGITKIKALSNCSRLVPSPAAAGSVPRFSTGIMANTTTRVVLRAFDFLLLRRRTLHRENGKFPCPFQT